MTDKKLITIALQLIRFHYEKDDTRFDKSCIELEEWLYDCDEIDLVEFVMACRCPAHTFVPMAGNDND